MLYINRLLQFDMCMLGKTYSLNILFWEQRFLWKNLLLIKLYSVKIQIQLFWYKYLIAKRHYLLEPLSWVKFLLFFQMFLIYIINLWIHKSLLKGIIFRNHTIGFSNTSKERNFHDKIIKYKAFLNWTLPFWPTLQTVKGFKVCWNENPCPLSRKIN